MGKVAFVLVFSLVLVLSIRSVLGAEIPAQSPTERAVDQAASEVKGAVSTVSDSAGKAMEDAKETTSTWVDWVKDKVEDAGLLSASPDSSVTFPPDPEGPASPGFI